MQFLKMILTMGKIAFIIRFKQIILRNKIEYESLSREAEGLAL
jgi:branched-subunit amino acid transport protein